VLHGVLGPRKDARGHAGGRRAQRTGSEEGRGWGDGVRRERGVEGADGEGGHDD
jgi:hypothetical protein